MGDRLMTMAGITMADVTPADRVLSAGHRDLINYRDRLVALGLDDHTEAAGRCAETVALAVERAIDEACRLHRRVAERTARCAAKGVAPERLHRDRVWVAADSAVFGALQVLAALLGGLYPKHDRPLPIHETQALVARRVGPVCTGWKAGGELLHSDWYPCPVHAGQVA